MTDLAQRPIIVTGAAGGIGRAAAHTLARRGAWLMLTDIGENDTRSICQEIVDAGGRAVSCAADVSREEEVAAMVERTIAEYGHLYGAFNNAGIPQSMALLHEMPLEAWRRVIDVDLTGVFLCMKHQIPHMIKGGSGTIVNTASSLSLIAIAHAAEYVAAKHGVAGLTRAAAADYATLGIRVNAVLPGIVDTPMARRPHPDPAVRAVFAQIAASVPMQRRATADEIAEAAAWLLSDAASFVTGTLLPVDGGYTSV